MSVDRRLASLSLGSVLVALSLGSHEAKASGDPDGWCAPEIDAVTRGVCHMDGGQQGPRRTLVIFLQGAVPRGTSDQWIQQRILLREAKQNGFEAIFPHAPSGADFNAPGAGAGSYLWPALVEKQETLEAGWIQSWRAAQAELERRAGRPFDDVFVIGFSSGAYLASSLALRGRLDFASGYAVLAGGAAYPPRPGELPRIVPVFVGICAEDDVSAKNARAFIDALVARGLPYKVDEEPVRHIISDVHMANAIAYLRSAVRRN